MVPLTLCSWLLVGWIFSPIPMCLLSSADRPHSHFPACGEPLHMVPSWGPHTGACRPFKLEDFLQERSWSCCAEGCVGKALIPCAHLPSADTLPRPGTPATACPCICTVPSTLLLLKLLVDSVSQLGYC